MIDRSIPPKDPSDRDDDLNQNRKHNDELLGVPTHATRGELLLNAIHDDPENTNLRLLYADWLDNDGNNPSLASFIRTDVEFSTTTCPDRREELRGYCDDWVNEHWRMFFESAPSAQIPGVEVLTKMGLPHEISFKWNAFSSIPHAELRWLVSQPVVTSLSIPGSVSQRELQRVMTFCEELRHVTLAVEASWTSDLTKGLTCSRLNKLENLTISDAQAIDPRILAELTSFAPNIRKLSLKRCSFSEGFIAQQTSSVDSLKVIEIDTCSGLRKIDLCFLPAVLPNLEVFIGNKLSLPSGGWVELPCNAWPSLDILAIENSTGLVASDIDALLRAAPALSRISFSGNDLEGGIFIEAATGQQFGRVKQIDLSYLPKLALRDYVAVREIFPDAQIYINRHVRTP